MGVVDGQWAVKYDSSKLKFNMADNKADGKQTIMPSQSNLIHNAYSNVIKGIFTNHRYLLSTTEIHLSHSHLRLSVQVLQAYILTHSTLH